MNYDVLIIGAGPGGIFSAYELILRNPGLKIGVLEAGHAATELPAVGLLAEKLKGLGMGLDVHISAVDSFR